MTTDRKFKEKVFIKFVLSKHRTNFEETKAKRRTSSSGFYCNWAGDVKIPSVISLTLQVQKIQFWLQHTIFTWYGIMENKIKGINFAEKRKAFCRVDYVTRKGKAKTKNFSPLLHSFCGFSCKIQIRWSREGRQVISQSNVKLTNARPTYHFNKKSTRAWKYTSDVKVLNIFHRLLFVP